MNSIFHRTSIRKYQDRPVEPEKNTQKFFMPVCKHRLRLTNSLGNSMW